MKKAVWLVKYANNSPAKQKRLLLIPYFFILPAFILHLCIVTLPSLSTLAMSFFDWNGIGKAKYIGLVNFINLFTKDKVFKVAFINNIKWLAVFITIPIILGLIVAVLVSSLKKSQMLLRTIYFLPYILSAAIAGKIWASYLNPYFGMGSVFKAIGLEKLSSVLWLGNPKIALYTVAFVDNWHWWGFIMILFLGALQQIEPQLYESARVEGATKIKEFFNITVPGVMPTFVFILITTIMWSFLTFDYIWIMTMGGPAQATEIMSTWIYKNAFVQYKAGYANAICVIQSILSISAYWILQIIRKRGWDV